MMACFECSQTFKMFYFHSCGGNQGWAERKHIFHGTNWPAFWTVHVCTLQHHKERGRRMEWVRYSLYKRPAVGKGILIIVVPSPGSFATKTISLTTAPLWNPRLAFTLNTKHVPNCMCCLGLLLFLTLLGMHHLLLDWENRVRTVCCGNCCKLESVPLGC